MNSRGREVWSSHSMEHLINMMVNKLNTHSNEDEAPWDLSWVREPEQRDIHCTIPFYQKLTQLIDSIKNQEMIPLGPRVSVWLNRIQGGFLRCWKCFLMWLLLIPMFILWKSTAHLWFVHLSLWVWRFIKIYFSGFFFKILLFLFLPKASRYIVVCFMFLVMGPSSCGMWEAPQHGLMSGAMSTPKIWTGETLGRHSGAWELNHSATRPAPDFSGFLKQFFLSWHWLLAESP